MVYFAGIDGTGCEDRDEYRTTFSNSCINQLARNKVVPFDDTYYHRGPTNEGTETYAIAQVVMNQVISHWRTGNAKAIFLGGYSRGAAAAIEVATWLNEQNIPVECLILFDAVDRSLAGKRGGGVGGVIKNTPIPANVKQTIHPMRDISRSLSRVTFGRCGATQVNPSMPHARGYFFATHGGVGGVPWNHATVPEPWRKLPEWAGNYPPSADIPNPTGTIWETCEPQPTRVTPAADSAGAAAVRAWTYSKVIQAFFECKQNSQKPPVPALPGLPGSSPIVGAPSGGQVRIHVVKPGDWLSKIAITYYGDMNKWPLIFEANKHQITHQDKIYPGQKLIIP
jgi:hypothetical protein